MTKMTSFVLPLITILLLTPPISTTYANTDTLAVPFQKKIIQHAFNQQAQPLTGSAIDQTFQVGAFVKQALSQKGITILSDQLIPVVPGANMDQDHSAYLRIDKEDDRISYALLNTPSRIGLMTLVIEGKRDLKTLKRDIFTAIHDPKFKNYLDTIATGNANVASQNPNKITISRDNISITPSPDNTHSIVFLQFHYNKTLTIPTIPPQTPTSPTTPPPALSTQTLKNKIDSSREETVHTFNDLNQKQNTQIAIVGAKGRIGTNLFRHIFQLRSNQNQVFNLHSVVMRKHTSIQNFQNILKGWFFSNTLGTLLPEARPSISYVDPDPQNGTYLKHADNLTSPINKSNLLSQINLKLKHEDSHLYVIKNHDKSKVLFTIEYFSNFSRFIIRDAQKEHNIILDTHIIEGLRSPEDLKVADDVDVIIDSSGAFRTKETAEQYKTHNPNVKLVVITAPGQKEGWDDITYVHPLKTEALQKGLDQKLISCASCTTNGAAAVVKLMKEIFLGEAFDFTTTHAATNSQVTTESFAPSSATTGASTALTQVLNGIDKNNISGRSLRIPTENVSLINLNVTTQQATTAAQINDIFKHVADLSLSNILFVSENLNHSYQLANHPGAQVVYLPGTTVQEFKTQDGTSHYQISLQIWYNNEHQYSTQVLNTVAQAAVYEFNPQHDLLTKSA